MLVCSVFTIAMRFTYPDGGEVVGGGAVPCDTNQKYHGGLTCFKLDSRRVLVGTTTTCRCWDPIKIANSTSRCGCWTRSYSDNNMCSSIPLDALLLQLEYVLYYKLAKFKNFKLFRATGPVFIYQVVYQSTYYISEYHLMHFFSSSSSSTQSFLRASSCSHCR